MKSLTNSLVTSLLVTGVIFGSTCVIAADQQGNFETLGNFTCSTYLTKLKLGGLEEMTVIQYVSGYLTAYNRQTPKTINILGSSDFNGAIFWLKNYCEKQPLERIGIALVELTAELYPKRTKNLP